MAETDREAWLASEGRARLARLADLVEAEARPWHERDTPLTRATTPTEGWYRDYPG